MPPADPDALDAALDAYAEAGERGTSPDPATIVAELDAPECAQLEALVRERLRALPTPIFAGSGDALERRRAALGRLVAHLADRLGRPGELIDVHRGDWLRGGSVMPLLELLRDHHRADEATMTARLALLSAEGAEEEAIEAFLTRDGQPPDGWARAVRAFARAPSVEGWEALFQFTPPEVYYHRVRATLRLLRRLGVPSDTVFKLATHRGVTPDAIELAESGAVDVNTILDRMTEAPARSRSLWLGLAARAAFAQGDRFGTVRFLSEAYRASAEGYLPVIQTTEIREQADDELNAMLDRAGVPRFEGDD